MMAAYLASFFSISSFSYKLDVKCKVLVSRAFKRSSCVCSSRPSLTPSYTSKRTSSSSFFMANSSRILLRDSRISPILQQHSSNIFRCSSTYFLYLIWPVPLWLLISLCYSSSFIFLLWRSIIYFCYFSSFLPKVVSVLTIYSVFYRICSRKFSFLNPCLEICSLTNSASSRMFLISMSCSSTSRLRLTYLCFSLINCALRSLILDCFSIFFF